MTSDADREVLDRAWGLIPQSRETTAGLGTFTRTRIERVLTLVVGLACILLGGQAFVAALAGGSGDRPGWHEALMIAAFVPLAAMILACLIGRGVALFAGSFAFIYLLVLVAWPIATAGSDIPDTAEPWPWYLVNVATVAAVLAFPLPLQIAWGVLTPLLFGIVRLIQGGFSLDLWISVSLDVSFSLILGGVLITLGWLFRAVAVNVDETRARAVSSYAAAAAADAAEQERVAVAGLMHDSVLAALIAAERAHTPRERALAVGMAREALTRLANTDATDSEGSDEPIAADTLADAIERAAGELGVSIRAQRSGTGEGKVIPGRVARSLVLAATQAIANSVQHADAEGLAVAVSVAESGGVSVVVRDTGHGFDMQAMPADRLGIRASIIARVTAIGGRADVESGERGTTVTLTWAGA